MGDFGEVLKLCPDCRRPIEDCPGHPENDQDSSPRWLSSRYDADLMVDD